MQPIAIFIGLLYIAILLSLAFYGLNNLVISFLYLMLKLRPKVKKVVPPPKQWPAVTIQLPIYNEKYTVKRLLQAITRLDYPGDKLQIQVLDDSTDDTAQLVSQLVDEYKSQGVNIERLHRTNRQGYKAGALSEGLQSASGEIIGIFDADFVPEPDWLKKTVPFFQNEKLGCLQTRWGHTNRHYNSLTRAEALGIDGHFVIEQTVRFENDLFLNFNGTAGLWRRSCIEDAGGWKADTLTEDLDLSYRAQLRGWKIAYLPDVVVPAELPSQVEAFKKQQFRWAKGSIQVVKKILPQVLKRKDFPWYVRLMAFMHLTGYVVHPLMLALMILILPVGLLIPEAFKATPITTLASLGPPLLYMLVSGFQTIPLRDRLKLLPLLTVTGFGISLSTSAAVFEGLVGKKGGVFVRTPKLAQLNARKSNTTIDHSYLEPISPLVWAEIGLGLYSLLTMIILYPVIGWGIIPWMTIYMIGYFYIAGLNLLQHSPKRGKQVRKYTYSRLGAAEASTKANKRKSTVNRIA
jgi:cellulose synthase/poly-beta-1,6-N-acetylglucosamine synthase-like glycosyltransferase